jgi:hypothetical protein
MDAQEPSAPPQDQAAQDPVAQDPVGEGRFDPGPVPPDTLAKMSRRDKLRLIQSEARRLRGRIPPDAPAAEAQLALWDGIAELAAWTEQLVAGSQQMAETLSELVAYWEQQAAWHGRDYDRFSADGATWLQAVEAGAKGRVYAGVAEQVGQVLAQAASAGAVPGRRASAARADYGAEAGGEAIEADLARCQVCGCTSESPCAGGCLWVADAGLMVDVCSNCYTPKHRLWEPAGGAEGWPSRDEWLAAYAAAVGDRRIAPGWGARSGLLARLRHLAEDTAAARIADQDVILAQAGMPDSIEWSRVRIRLAQFAGEAHERWALAVARYARLAEGALHALAAGQVPDPRTALLPGEDQPPTLADARAAGEVQLPEVQLPEVFAGVPLLRLAAERLARCQAANAEYIAEFGCDHDDAAPCAQAFHIPEHAVAQAAALETEMARLPEYLADFADAVVYVLCTQLRPRLHTSQHTGAAEAAVPNASESAS